MRIKRKKIPFWKRKIVLERDTYKCHICGATSIQSKLEVDHIIPLSRGGTDDIDNYVTLCFDCNRGKSSDIVRVPKQPKVNCKPLPIKMMNFGYFWSDMKFGKRNKNV